MDRPNFNPRRSVDSARSASYTTAPASPAATATATAAPASPLKPNPNPNPSSSPTPPAENTPLPRSRPGRSVSHSLNIPSSASRKSRHAEPGTTDAHSATASLSMPPPSSIPLKPSRSSLSRSRRESNNSLDAWSDSILHFADADDLDTPRLASTTPGSGSGSAAHNYQDPTAPYRPLPE
ncbi:hypothetical protein CTA2_5773, partial [Colletotrichum tanaceti]